MRSFVDKEHCKVAPRTRSAQRQIDIFVSSITLFYKANLRTVFQRFFDFGSCYMMLYLELFNDCLEPNDAFELHTLFYPVQSEVSKAVRL